MFEPGGGGGGLDMAGKTKKKKNCKRRFTDEQVRSLETMFENETKLEPRQKAEVASQLGLHPRQVAIWFQNKRARWKSKQLEHDFDVLRRSYDSLASRFDLLKKENQSLSLQVQNLKNLLGDTQEDTTVGVPDGGSFVITATDQESEIIHKDHNSNKKKKMKSTGVEEDEEKPGLADIGGSDCMNTNYLAMEEERAEFLVMVEPACSSLTSDEEWHGLQSDNLFEQSPSSCEWWDFWT